MQIYDIPALQIYRRSDDETGALSFACSLCYPQEKPKYTPPPFVRLSL